MTMKIDNFAGFAEAHPLRIDITEDQHLRFSDLRCAARSAVSWGRDVWDESQERAITLAECKKIIDRYAPFVL